MARSPKTSSVFCLQRPAFYFFFPFFLVWPPCSELVVLFVTRKETFTVLKVDSETPTLAVTWCYRQCSIPGTPKGAVLSLEQRVSAGYLWLSLCYLPRPDPLAHHRRSEQPFSLFVFWSGGGSGGWGWGGGGKQVIIIIVGGACCFPNNLSWWLWQGPGV